MERLIRRREFMRLLGVSRVTMWRLERDGVIPAPTMLGSLAGWPESVVQAVIRGTPLPDRGAANDCG